MNLAQTNTAQTNTTPISIPKINIAQINIEKRLANTEKALIALCTLIQRTLPTESVLATDKMMEEYFKANEKLGASLTLSPDFITN